MKFTRFSASLILFMIFNKLAGVNTSDLQTFGGQTHKP